MPLLSCPSPGQPSAASHQSSQEAKSSPSAAFEGSVPSSGVNSRDILKGEKAVAISHNGLTYRLQATRLGKLILTK